MYTSFYREIRPEGWERVPAAYPSSRKAISPARKMALIPYGCAKLRMTEMPMLR